MPQKVEQVRVAIVGVGQRGVIHSAIFQQLPGARVVGIADSNARLVSLASRLVPRPKIYTDTADMIRESRANAVVVCTPVDTHAKVVSDVMRSGGVAGILVEKPLAPNYGSAVALADSARSASVTSLVGLQKRFIPSFAGARKWILDGRIGMPVFFRSHWLASSVTSDNRGWKFEPRSGGVTLECGVHLFDMLAWMFGHPNRVEAVPKSIYSTQVEDFVHVDVGYPSGLVGTLDISWSAQNYFPPEMAIEVFGTAGVVVVNDDRALLYQSPQPVHAGARNIESITSASEWGNLPFLLFNAEDVLLDLSFVKSLLDGVRCDPDFEFAAAVTRTLDQVRSVWIADLRKEPE